MAEDATRSQGLGRRLRRVERLMYVLPVAPVLTDVIERRGLPSSPREWLTELTVALGIFLFILLLRSTRKDIEAIDGLRKSLTQVAVHDLKNPLTSIIAAVSATLSGPAEDDARRKLLDIALNSARRQSELIDTLLDIDRLENRDLPLKRGRIRTERLLAGTLEEALPAARVRGVRLVNETPAAADFEGDEELLHRVLANLLQNALKYSHEGGSVRVSAVRGAREMLLQVADGGAGVPMPQVERLFEKFYRVEGRDQSRRRGTGLGLYFCRLVAQAHGGSIRAENRPEGGLLVSMRLPQDPPGIPAGDSRLLG